MKKTLLLMLALCGSLVASAQNSRTYTDDLVVTVNGESTLPQSTTVTVIDNNNGTINFQLKNFSLVAGEESLGVGNIEVNGLTTEQLGDTCRTFTFNDSITISDGDDPNVSMWIGPMLGKVPLALKGKVSDGRIFVSIDIDMMESIQQVIYVKLGTNDFPATNYTDSLVVSVNEDSTDPMLTTVQVVKNSEDNIDFRLTDFSLVMGEESLGVGSIVVSDLTLTPAEDDTWTFEFNDSILIEEGSDTTKMWMGPMLGKVPLQMQGRLSNDKLYVTIDIDMQESIGQIIKVRLGDAHFPHYCMATFLVEGDTIATQKLKQGAVIEAPVMPEREGYTFEWTNLPDSITADTTIVGAYLPNTYTVYYKVGDDIFAQVEVKYGEAIPEAPVYTPVDTPEYTYTFEGWQGDTYDTMPAHDVIYTAQVKATPTAIAGIAADGHVQGKAYDLQGRRVQRATRGIIIVNGKKVMVK